MRHIGGLGEIQDGFLEGTPLSWDLEDWQELGERVSTAGWRLKTAGTVGAWGRDRSERGSWKFKHIRWWEGIEFAMPENSGLIVTVRTHGKFQERQRNAQICHLEWSLCPQLFSVVFSAEWMGSPGMERVEKKIQDSWLGKETVEDQVWLR